MSANLPESRNPFSAARRFGKLSVLLIATVFCTAFVLHAIEKSSYWTNPSQNKGVNQPGRTVKKKLTAAAPNRRTSDFDAPPTLSYGSRNFVFTQNVAVSLTPTSSNVAAPAPNVYGSPAVLGSGLNFSQNGAALDAAGNMYVCDQDGGTGNVKKISADGTSTTIIGSGFLTQSSNVVVDEDGNVYVADQSRVWKIPAGATPGTYDAPAVLENTFTRPFGIAIDAVGSLYVTDLNTAGVYKMDRDGGNKVRIDAGGFSYPTAVVADAAGNVYVTDYNTQKLYEILVNTSSPIEVATGFAASVSLAIDGAGNLYINDKSTGIYKIPSGGGTPVLVVSPLTNNVGLAIDASYNLYIALQGSGGISKFSPTGGYFISPAVLPAGLSFNNTTGDITGTPTNISTKQYYTISAYNSAGGVADTISIRVSVPAAAVSYSNPNVDTAGVKITPITPLSTGVDVPGYGPKEVLATGFSAPYGLATDAAGNIYVADKGHNQVKKIPAAGGTAVSLGTGFSAPSGTVVDAAGNIYVADADNGEVKKMSADGNTITSIGTGFSTPVGVALDDAGNVYVADAGNESVYKILASDGSTVTLSGTFDNLTGIAVDKTGQNIYVSDGPAQSVYKVSPGCGCPEDVGFAFNYPTGVALDPAGNLYVSDADLVNNTGLVYKADSKTCNFTDIGAAFIEPRGVTVDPLGNVLIDDATANKLYQVSPSGGYFLSTALPKGLKLNDTTGVIKGKPVAISPATDYTVYAYNARGGTPGTVNIAVVLPPAPTISYNTPNVYLAGTAITSLTPTSQYVAGTPAYADAPVVIGSGFGTPKGTAIDKAGNVFVADSLNNRIMRIPAGGGAAAQWGSGFNQPTGVAVDSLGFVYVADFGNGAVKKISPDGAATTAIGSGISTPNSVAVDTVGNVYATDLSTGLVFEIKASDGSTVELNDSFLFDYPTGIATDGKYIYVSDGGGYHNAVTRFSAGGIPQSIGPFNYPAGVAVDVTGNLYVADEGDSTIYRIPAHGTNITALSTTGISGPEGLAVDGKGNVYVADVNNGEVAKIVPTGGYYINKALPAGLSFNSRTGSIHGTPTAASAAKDYLVTGYNTASSASALFNIAVNLPPPPTISYATPLVYTVNHTIVPTAPTASGVAAPGHGGGITTVDTGYVLPYGLGISHAGDIYIVDAGRDTLFKIPAGGGARQVVGSGFVGPLAVAFDSADNIYVADAGNNVIKKIPKTGGAPVQIGPAFNYPAGVAVDRDNSVYVADQGAGMVFKIDAHGTLSTVTGGISGAASLAIDAAGTVYVTDPSSGRVYKILKNSGTAIDLGYTFGAPAGIAVDASGNIFVSDAVSGVIDEIPAAGGSIIPITGFLLPFGVAMDGAGNLYVTDPGDRTLKKVGPSGGFYISPFLPAGLSFDNTSGIISGKPTVSSPATDYTVTAYNFGGGVTAHVNIKVLSSTGLLSSLSLSPSTPLSRVTGSDYIDYTANVYSPLNSIKVIPKTKDADVTITINGVAATPGVESAPVALNADTTAIAVTVTAGDGITKKTYRIVVTRVPSNNARLGKLSLSPTTPLTWTHGAGPNYADYTANIVNSISSVKVIPVTADNTATVTVNGVAATPGVESAPVALKADTTAIAVTVTAGDGITKETYRIVVTHVPSSNALLSKLSLSPTTPLTWTHGAGPNYVDYTANIVNTISSVKVIPVVADSTATVSVNGVAAASGVESAPITLNTDTTAIAVTVTAADGTTRKTYRIVVTHVPSNNALLSKLSLSPSTTLTWTHGVGPDYVDYTANIFSSIGSVKVIPVTADAGATVTVNGVAATPGAESAPITLHTDTTAIAVTVTAADGITKKTYRIVVTHVPSDNARLAKLSLSPATPLTWTHGAGPDYADYTANVVNTISSVKVIPVTADVGATVTVNGVAATPGVESAPVTLKVDTTAIAVTVTAANGTTKQTYRIVVTHVPSDNARLGKLTLSPSTPLTKVSGPDYLDYTATVANSVSSVKVIPVTADNGATVTVNGVATTSGAESAPITLHTDTTTIATTVTASNGVTKDSYVILITRLPPPSGMMAYQPQESPIFSKEIVVHQNVSPNGDGKGDVMLIDGITAYPDNKLQIMSRSGNLVYEAKGYDNATKVFDGHANDGKLQQAGTYFYSLEYKVGNEIKRKTGFVVLKY